jgi:hypothetical protein
VTNFNPQGLSLSVAAAFFFTAICLFHLMVFRVIKLLPPGEKIPYYLDLRRSNRLAAEYKALYPHSILYELTLVCAVSVFVLALAFVFLRFRS